MKRITQTVDLIDLTQEPFDLMTVTLRIPGRCIEKLRMISFLEGLSPSGWLEKLVSEYPLFELNTAKGAAK